MTHLEHQGVRMSTLVYLGSCPLARTVWADIHRVNNGFPAMTEEYSRRHRHTVERQQLSYSSITMCSYGVKVYPTGMLLAPCNYR